jgi:hypothetical protein
MPSLRELINKKRIAEHEKLEKPATIRFLHDEGLSPSYFFVRHDHTGFARHQAELADEWIRNHEAEGLIIEPEPYTKEPPPTPPGARELRPLQRYYLHAMRGKSGWVKPPKRPTKAEGRKGTKRDWKRINPPRFTFIATTGRVETVAIGAHAMSVLLEMVRRREYLAVRKRRRKIRSRKTRKI